MKNIVIKNRTITRNDTYVIVEIGSNHNADIELCKKMFIKAKECGANAVKLQKRDNRKMFMKSILNSPYQSEYAKETGTYGEHREKLDGFGKDEYKELRELAYELDIDFLCTPFDFESLEFLEEFNLDAYKIASCDLLNYPLIARVIQTGKPLIISTGGGEPSDIQNTYDFVSARTDNFSMLHCVSKYPNSDKDVNLASIRWMDMHYDCIVGWSSHHPGLLCNFLAYMLGARIFEVHFTFNRAWADINKDHAFSVEPQALRKICYDLKRIPVMLGTDNREIDEKESKGFVWKFGKAVHPIRSICKGEILNTDNIGLRSPADGIKPEYFYSTLGKIAICDISTSDILTEDKIE